jgi:hypothetical protein
MLMSSFSVFPGLLLRFSSLSVVPGKQNQAYSNVR